MCGRPRQGCPWRCLLDDDVKRRFQGIVVFKLDRAFRPIKDMYDTLGVLEAAGTVRGHPKAARQGQVKTGHLR